MNKVKPFAPANPIDSQSRACPAACGSLIATKDSHPFYMVCMRFKHAEEALSLPENCSHCLALSKKLLHRRLTIASTQSTDIRAGESTASLGASQGMPALSWADRSDGGLHEEILPGISLLEYEP